MSTGGRACTQSTGGAGAQHGRTRLCMSPDPLSQVGQPWERSLADPRASARLPAMAQGLPHVRDLCTVLGAAAPYHGRFPLRSSLLSLLPSQATQTTCFTSPQPCLSPRVQGGRGGDATPQLASPSTASRAPASLHPAHRGQMPAMG